MGKANDLTNCRFGKLVALYRVENKIYPSGTQAAVWHCQCDCGNEKDIVASSLTKGHTKSCGCLSKESLSQRSSKHLEGQKFGKLLVLQRTNQKKGSYYLWLCLCDCGNTCLVTTNNLTQGCTKSCGCLGHNSKGEEKICSILRENNISFEREKYFKDCKNLETNRPFRFDFYINNKYLIEFDGIQHFETTTGFFQSEEKLQKTQEYDKIKNQYCFDNNIPLIRIPYTQYDNLCLEDLLLETSKFIVNAGTEV